MSRKGGRNREQHGGAHGRAHAESSRPQAGLISGISLAAEAGRTVVEDRHRPVTTSRCRPAASRSSATAAAFQDGETTQQCTARHDHQAEENNTEFTAFSPSLSSSSSPSTVLQIHQCPVRIVSSSSSAIANNINGGSSSSSNTIITTTSDKKNQAKSKTPLSRGKIVTTANRKTDISRGPRNSGSISLKTIASGGGGSNNINNATTTMAIHNLHLQYLSSNLSSASDYDYDDEEEEVEAIEENDDVVEDLDDDDNYDQSVVENSTEWFKSSRCRNLDPVEDLELVGHQPTTHSVVDTLDIGTGKASKDIVVDDLFAGEHLAVSPDPAGVIPPLTETDHVVLSTTENESVALYTSSSDSNGHSIVDVDNNAIASSIPISSSVSSKTCTVVGNTSLNSPVSSSPPFTSRSTISSTCTINTVCTTPTAISADVGSVVLETEGKCGVSTSYSSASTADTLNRHPGDDQETLVLQVPLLEFKAVDTDKSNTLMTPQELESMPDRGIEFEESVGPKQEITSSLASRSGPDNLSAISCRQNLTPSQTGLLETPVQVSSPNLAAEAAAATTTITTTTTTTTSTTNNTIIFSSTSGDSLAIDTKPVFVDNPLMAISDTPTINTSNSNKNNLCSSSSSSSNNNNNNNNNNNVIATTNSSTASSSSTITTSSATSVIDSALNTNVFNSGNFTLATISISTDRSTNSTRILVNTNQGQQLYHINTADLTKAQTLPISQPEAPTSNGLPTTTTTVSTTSTTTTTTTTTTTNGASPQTGAGFIFVCFSIVSDFYAKVLNLFAIFGLRDNCQVESGRVGVL